MFNSLKKRIIIDIKKKIDKELLDLDSIHEELVFKIKYVINSMDYEELEEELKINDTDNRECLIKIVYNELYDIIEDYMLGVRD